MTKRRSVLLLALAALAFLSGPAGAQAPRGYSVRVGDQFEVQVFRHPELTRTVTVPPDGKMFFPFVGELAVAGLSLSEIASRITRALQPELNRPMVSLNLLRQRTDEVNALGAVGRPGRVTLGEGWKLLDLLAACGGVTTVRPDWLSATLVRSRDGSTSPVNLEALLKKGDAGQNLPLSPGDTLLVSEQDPATLSVRVLGEVGKPGVVPIPTDGSLTTLLASIGGPSPKAALTRARILRGATTIPLDLSALARPGGVLPEIKLLAGDTLLIPPARDRFAVFGAVGRPGVMDLADGDKLTLIDALSAVGGPTPGADLKKVHLIRAGATSLAEVVDIDVDALMKSKSATMLRIPLFPGDVLYVEAKNQKNPFTWRDALSAATFLFSVVR